MSSTQVFSTLVFVFIMFSLNSGQLWLKLQPQQWKDNFPLVLSYQFTFVVKENVLHTHIHKIMDSKWGRLQRNIHIEKVLKLDELHFHPMTALICYEIAQLQWILDIATKTIIKSHDRTFWILEWENWVRIDTKQAPHKEVNWNQKEVSAKSIT